MADLSVQQPIFELVEAIFVHVAIEGIADIQVVHGAVVAADDLVDANLCVGGKRSRERESANGPWAAVE